MQPKTAQLNGPIIHPMPSGDEIRSARSFLRGHLYNRAGTEIQPKRFAAAAKETGASYSDLLGVIARSYSAGQGQDEQRRIDVSNAAKASGAGT